MPLIEEWRPVNGVAYQVSNLGSVRSQKRKGTPGKVLRASSSRGYIHVTLSVGGAKITRTVHQLVARAFLGAPLPRQQVNHINGIKDDNRASNLEWALPSQNIRHGFATGLIARPHGEASPTSKLSQAQINEIRQLGHTLSQPCLARRFGVHQSSINRIIRGTRWRASFDANRKEPVKCR